MFKDVLWSDWLKLRNYTQIWLIILIKPLFLTVVGVANYVTHIHVFEENGMVGWTGHGPKSSFCMELFFVHYFQVCIWQYSAVLNMQMGVEATFVLSYSQSILLSIKDDMGLAVGRNDKCYDVFVFPYIRESDGVTGTFPYFEF